MKHNACPTVLALAMLLGLAACATTLPAQRPADLTIKMTRGGGQGTEGRARADELVLSSAYDSHYKVEYTGGGAVTLALDVSEEESPAEQVAVDPLAGVPRLSPLAWVLAYQYPVHRIGPSYRPESAEQPTYLAVYRDRDDKVRFMELNAATARLLERVRDNEDACGADLLEALAAELGMEPANVRDFGASQLAEFIEKSVVYVA